jgi:hypothetical protein
MAVRGRREEIRTRAYQPLDMGEDLLVCFKGFLCEQLGARKVIRTCVVMCARMVLL